MPPASHDPALDRVAHPVDRLPSDEGFYNTLSGDLAQPRRRAGWHVFGLVTGLVLLPHAASLLGRLLGYRRRATLNLDGGFITVEARIKLLGGVVQESEVRLREAAVAGVALGRAQPALLLLVGALLGLGIALFGGKLLFDGLTVKATSLVLTGAGILALGIGVDLAAFALGRYLAARRGVEVTILGVQGPLVTLAGVEPARASRFAQALRARLAPGGEKAALG